MQLHGTIQDGKLTLPAIQKELRQRFLTSMKNGALVRETLVKEGVSKTHKQVKTQFGLVVEMVRIRLDEMGVDVCGVPCNKEMVYDILKKSCGGVGDMGETLGLSEMTIEQARMFFNNCQTWAATQLQLVIPDPNPDWKQQAQIKVLKGEKDGP